MATETESAATHSDGSVILIGYTPGGLRLLTKYLPDHSVVFIDEPDVLRHRDAVATSANIATLRELVEWELYEIEGAADSFYNANRQRRPAGILPVTDYGVPFASRLAERYGLPGAGYGAARALRDKQLLRKVARSAGIPNPESIAVDTPDDVKAFMTQIGGPVVIKPANRQASIGTKIVSDPDEVDSAWLDCLDQDEGVFAPDRAMPLRMLAEQYIRGDEFSVEMMVHHGRVVFGGVTRTILFDGPRPVEQGHLHPADISAELTARLLTQTECVLDAVGMDSGFAHCEWRVQDGVPYLLECAGRMAGDGIIDLVSIATGYDATGQFFEMMQGREPAQVPASPTRYAAVWMVAWPPGEVESIDGAQDVLDLHGVHSCWIRAKVGEKIKPLRSSFDRAVEAQAEGATPAEALANAQAACEHITFKIKPADRP